MLELLLDVAKRLLGLGFVPSRADIEAMIKALLADQLAKIADDAKRAALEAEFVGLLDRVAAIVWPSPDGSVPDLGLDIEYIDPHAPVTSEQPSADESDPAT